MLPNLKMMQAALKLNRWPVLSPDELRELDRQARLRRLVGEK